MGHSNSSNSPTGLRHWNPGWRMSISVCVLLPLLVSLGFWQLERAAEKRGYATRYFERMGSLAVQPFEGGHDTAFQRIKLSGSYEPGRYFLLDNQVRAGHVGYWVLASFLAGDGRRWLVNRGWIEAGANREILPEVAAPAGDVSIVGVIWPDTGLLPLLAEDLWPPEWP